MFSIENICESLSTFIAKQLNFDNDKKSIINYGLFAVIQMFICILLVIIFGVVFNVLVESLIVSFAISILRRSSGGIHARTPNRCAVIGTAVVIILAFISKKVNITFSNEIFIGVFVFLWSYHIIYKLAPVDSIAKPIKNIKMRKRLRRASMITISIYLIIVIIISIMYTINPNNCLFTYILCIYMGLIWQVFSLTKIGHLVIGKLG